VSHWNEADDKILCLDFTEILSLHVIEDDMLLSSQMNGAPLLMDEFPMRELEDGNGIWAKLLNALRHFSA
jgi:hypothetical protein